MGSIMLCQAVITAILVTSTTSDLTQLLGTLTKQIVLKYFLNVQPNNLCLGIVIEESNELLDYLLPLDTPTVQVNLSHQELQYSKPLDSEFEEYAWERKVMASINMPCLVYVIQTTDIMWMVKSFGRMFHSEKASQRYNRTFLYVPVITRLMSDRQFEDHISQIFAMKEMDFMPDLDIVKIVKEMCPEFQYVNSLLPGDSTPLFEDMDIEIITHRYASLTPSERILLDVWNMKHGFIHGADLFPYKMSNMMGKIVTLVTLDYPPVAVIDRDKDPVAYDGLETQFLYEWARRSNFTYNWAQNDDFWGMIYRNGSGMGLLGLLSMDRADIGFCAMFLWEVEHHFLDYSNSHSKTEIILVCPKPNLLPAWMTPILPFNYNMWLGIVISVVICTTVLYMVSLASSRFLGSFNDKKVNMYSSWTECGFRTLGLLVLQVPPDERDWSTPRFVPMRHLVTWLILFYFVVTTAYCGGLATVLTVPRYEKPIETARDMVEHKIKWTGMYDTYLNSIQNSMNPILKQVERNFELDVEGDELIPWLIAKIETRKYCFAVEKMLGGAFYLPPFIDEDKMNYLRIMKEDLYSSLTVFGTRKGSPFKQALNKFLGMARDGGLFYYWEALTVRNYLSTRKQLAVTQSRADIDEGPTNLLIHHIQGAFYLLGIGLTASTTVYICEILMHRISSMKKQEHYFRKLELSS